MRRSKLDILEFLMDSILELESETPEGVLAQNSTEYRTPIVCGPGPACMHWTSLPPESVMAIELSQPAGFLAEIAKHEAVSSPTTVSTRDKPS